MTLFIYIVVAIFLQKLWTIKYFTQKKHLNNKTGIILSYFSLQLLRLIILFAAFNEGIMFDFG